MPLKAKLILLTILPVMIVTASIGWITLHQAKALGENEIKIFRESLIESKESALKDSVEIAFAAISHIYNDPFLDKDTAQNQVKQILTQLRFGADGYFFVYDKHGTNLVHPILPSLVGRNLLKLQDQDGDYLIEALLFQAQSGGGVHEYKWQKPSSGEVVPKLSYASWLEEWEWMVGTGLYIEDVGREVQALRTEINNNIQTTVFSIVVILAVTVAVIIVLTLAINWHEHKLADRNLKELAHKTVMFQEDEKKHLARELHDGVNQLLVSAKCHLELLGQQEGGVLCQAHLDKSQSSLSKAITEVRRISHNLRPSALDDIGLEAALTTLLQDFKAYSKSETEIILDTQPGKLKSEIATTLYRVVQESLNNIEKHANASKVDVYLQQFGDVLQLLVRDDGVGFDVNNAIKRKGIGLRNMRERVEFIGAEFEIMSDYDSGTEITVLLDLKGAMR
ncbi:cache domain-containing protein [Vibrio sp. ZSDZ34]|uniref:Cache domain-containing protein n=1 Tax=Vibrio gelatinilyticus TaxID=2893468 RepID=A0A9X1WB03_9VIBR|nr:cache domain-containing protein [Vibrio gelatinilyticus]MCJ2375255.1 cache domain-containing protein [Vibrio gelatinilyticus]